MVPHIGDGAHPEELDMENTSVEHTVALVIALALAAPEGAPFNILVTDSVLSLGWAMTKVRKSKRIWQMSGLAGQSFAEQAPGLTALDLK